MLSIVFPSIVTTIVIFPPDCRGIPLGPSHRVVSALEMLSLLTAVQIRTSGCPGNSEPEGNMLVMTAEEKEINCLE